MSLDSIDQFPISLKLYFEESIHIALIRIWNHNKSRIYWDRGIKNIQMFLDERRIFQGEITRVHGSLSSPVYNLGDVSVNILIDLFSTRLKIFIHICLFFSSPLDYLIHYGRWNTGENSTQ